MNVCCVRPHLWHWSRQLHWDRPVVKQGGRRCQPLGGCATTRPALRGRLCAPWTEQLPSAWPSHPTAGAALSVSGREDHRRRDVGRSLGRMAASNDADTGRTDACVLLRYGCVQTHAHTRGGGAEDRPKFFTWSSLLSPTEVSYRSEPSLCSSQCCRTPGDRPSPAILRQPRQTGSPSSRCSSLDKPGASLSLSTSHVSQVSVQEGVCVPS